MAGVDALFRFDGIAHPEPTRWCLAALCAVLILLAFLIQRRVERTRRAILEQTDKALARGKEVLDEYREYVDACVERGVVPLEPEELYRVRKAMQALREIKSKYA